MVHLGLGAFFRAHQAWYTDRAPDADEWGIAAFTGRSAALAETLRAQGSAYTLVTQGPSGPTPPGTPVRIFVAIKPIPTITTK